LLLQSFFSTTFLSIVFFWRSLARYRYPDGDTKDGLKYRRHKVNHHYIYDLSTSHDQRYHTMNDFGIPDLVKQSNWLPTRQLIHLFQHKIVLPGMQVDVSLGKEAHEAFHLRLRDKLHAGVGLFSLHQLDLYF